MNEDIPADPATLIRLGTVASVDLAAARIEVLYGDPDDDGGGARTPPIRWLCPRAGETRVWSPPSVGEQVILLAPDGQIGAAIALAGVIQAAFPPAGSDRTEAIVWHDGARIAYDPVTHSLDVELPGGGTIDIRSPGIITIDARAGVTILGDVTIDGQLHVSDDAVVDGDVHAGPISLREHRHAGVKSGGELSGPAH